MLKYIYIIPKRTISAFKTAHFSSRNGPFGVLKRPVLQRKMACIGNLLIISRLRGWNEVQNNMIYFYILLSVFSPLFVFLQDYVC